MDDIFKNLPHDFWKNFGHAIGELKVGIDAFGGDRYLTRDELRYRIPGADSEAAWHILKMVRAFSGNLLPYSSLKLTYVLTAVIAEELHLCDQSLAQILRANEEKLREMPEYIFDALADEAIFSSKLEGAVTTEIVAKDMIRKNIPPQTKDERMIMNNHEAMQFILDKKDISLTPEFICEIQRIVTKGTLESEDQSGVFRTSDDVYVTKPNSAEVLHYPPRAEIIPSMISDLCELVNADRQGTGKFVHPLIVGIALHFLIGYIHPFYDGNGRTARTLFYWYILSRGYDIFQYIPISKIIKQAPAKYRDAYLATEQDDLDLTYFIHYTIMCIQQARKVLIDHLRQDTLRVQNSAEAISHLSDISRRQIRILSYMAEYPAEVFGIREIANRFSVTYQTARTDLMDLEARKYLWVQKRGKAFLYCIDENLAKSIGAVHITN